jgi:hypothetical protein
VWAELDQTPPDVLGGGLPFHDKPVDEALRLPLGAHTLALLTQSPVSEMSNTAKAWALKRSRDLIDHIEAFRTEVTASIAGPTPEDRRDDWGPHEIAVANRSSLYAADREVALSRALAGRLSATREAMSDGRITIQQARALFEGVAHLPDEIAQEIESRLLKCSYRQDLTLFKASLRRWLARLDPSWHEKAAKARKQVICEHTANDNGTGDLFIRGPLEFTSTINTALAAYAAATKPTLEGTSAERKLAGILAWAENYLTSPGAPKRHGRAITVNVTIDTPTLFGLANHHGEVIGYGMVPGQAALHLLADGSPLRRLIIDPDDGHLLHYGRTTYTVPPPLAAHLIALHVHSAGPHSTVPADGCDLDHNQPYHHGGTTDPDNNAPFDRRWHRAKTHTDWTWTYNKDRSITWTSPTGLTQTVHPHDYRLGP